MALDRHQQVLYRASGYELLTLGLPQEVLEHAGLISRGQDAQRRPRRLEAKPLAQATGWLDAYRQFWEGSFQRLDALLDEMKTKEKKRGRTKR